MNETVRKTLVQALAEAESRKRDATDAHFRADAALTRAAERRDAAHREVCQLREGLGSLTPAEQSIVAVKPNIGPNAWITPFHVIPPTTPLRELKLEPGMFLPLRDGLDQVKEQSTEGSLMPSGEIKRW